MVVNPFPVRDFTGTKLTALTYRWTKLSFKIVLMHLMLLGGREKITKHFPWSLPFSDPGMFMGSSTMPFTTQPSTHFQGFPAMGVPVPAATGMMGSMMGQSVPVMGQSTGVMVGMGMPNGFTGTTQTGVIGLPQNVVGPQGGMVGQMVTPQNKYGLQQNQQAQWNLTQVNARYSQIRVFEKTSPFQIQTA